MNKYQASFFKNTSTSGRNYKFVGKTTFFYYEGSRHGVVATAFMNAPEKAAGADKVSIHRIK